MALDPLLRSEVEQLTEDLTAAAALRAAADRHAALLAALPGLTASALASSVAPTTAAATQDAIATGPKVVIVVGATEITTATYRTDADAIAAEALKYTPNVIKIYSPNATWAAVKAAAQGASVFIYLGHGYGLPSPYKLILTPSVHDGMGLNQYANQGDSDKKYYGESYVSSEIRLAQNAVVILNHLCYSAGSSETGAPEPTIAVAKQRVDNFASGFLRAGARVVMADAWTGGAIGMIRGLFTTHQSINAVWHGLVSAHGHDIPWTTAPEPCVRGDHGSRYRHDGLPSLDRRQPRLADGRSDRRCLRRADEPRSGDAAGPRGSRDDCRLAGLHRCQPRDRQRRAAADGDAPSCGSGGRRGDAPGRIVSGAGRSGRDPRRRDEWLGRRRRSRPAGQRCPAAVGHGRGDDDLPELRRLPRHAQPPRALLGAGHLDRARR